MRGRDSEFVRELVTHATLIIKRKLAQQCADVCIVTATVSAHTPSADHHAMAVRSCQRRVPRWYVATS